MFGIKHILFFNVYSDLRLKDQFRKHPRSDLLLEKFVIPEPKDGKIDITIPVSSDSQVLALWISCDGDATESQYTVEIEALQLRS